LNISQHVLRSECLSVVHLETVKSDTYLGGKRSVPVILIVDDSVVHKHDVLWLDIGMDKIGSMEICQNGERAASLVLNNAYSEDQSEPGKQSL
jgi:hypothetical protein